MLWTKKHNEGRRGERVSYYNEVKDGRVVNQAGAFDSLTVLLKLLLLMSLRQLQKIQNPDACILIPEWKGALITYTYTSDCIPVRSGSGPVKLLFSRCL